MGASGSTKRIGKYSVDSVLGQGGMGVVYKAHDNYRSVAIKMMLTTLSGNPKLMGRFHREAQLTARLQHPDIVTLYDWGEQDGAPYLVMQYLEGSSLDSCRFDGSPTMALFKKLRIVSQVCAGLHYAHSQRMEVDGQIVCGIVHRDIKPANIFVLTDETAKLLDFGIAHLGLEGDDAERPMTRTGQLIGSLHYMSPEQANGTRLDTRTDIFSLGVVLYELVAGVRPFEGRDTISTITHILTSAPPPIENCPAELMELIQRALEKSPKDRYQTAEEFAFDLSLIDTRLRRQLAEEQLALAESAMERSDLVKALEILVELLKLDGEHVRGLSMHREIQRILRRQQPAEAAARLKAKATEALEKRHFKDALRLAEEAISLDESNYDLIVFRDDIRNSLQRAEKSRLAAERAENKLRSDRVPAAASSLDQALQLDPANTQALNRKPGGAEALTEQSRREQSHSLLENSPESLGEEIGALLTARSIDQAGEKLRTAMRSSPGEPSLLELEHTLSQLRPAGVVPLAEERADTALQEQRLATVANASNKSVLLPWLLLAMLLLAAFGLATWRMWPGPAAPFSSMSVSQMTNLGTLEDIAVSSDGKFLAQVNNDAGQRTIWLRNIATNTATQILNAFPQEYVGLSFSPDTNYLYFTRAEVNNNAVRALYAMPVFGGTPRLLINDVNSPPSFSPDGNRLTYLRWTPDRKDRYSEVHIADKDGSSDHSVYSSPYLSRAPAWSPRGNQIAWIESRGSDLAVIKIFDVSSKKERSIPQPSGILFDPVPVPARCDLAWLPDGRHLLILYTKPLSDRAQIGIIGVGRGDFSTVTNDVNAYSQLALSADGRTLATVLTNVDPGLAYYNGDGGAMLARTALRVTPRYFAWSDEDHLLLISRGVGVFKLERATGSVQPIDIGTLAAGVYITTCPNGQVLFTADAKPGGDHLLFRINDDGSDLTQLTTTGSARAPVCTPDNQKVYFTIRDKVQMSSLSLWSVPLSGGTPTKELDVQGQGSVILSRDATLAEISLPQDLVWYAVIHELATRQIVRRFSFDPKAAIRNSYPSFSPDNKAIVVYATDKNGNALLYQPTSGSPAHLMTEPTPETLTAFAWSPSGSKLGVLQVRKSSDVVLMSDLTGKQAH